MDAKSRYSLVKYSANPGARPVETSAAFGEELGVTVRAADFWGRKGRYNLLRYSVNLAKKTVSVSAVFSETLNAVAGSAVAVESGAQFLESMQGNIQGTLAIVSTFAACSGLFTLAEMSADVVASAAMLEMLQEVVSGQKNIPGRITSVDILAASMWGSKNIPAWFPAADALAVRAAGSKNIPAAFKAAEILTSILEATSQTTERTTLQLTIPPGGELRIDSDLFIVLLNGDNVLYTQSGDWINISRNLLRLIVESASGGQLQGQLIYTERYL